MVTVKASNGVSWGYKYSAVASDISAGYIDFDFGTSYDIDALFQVTSAAGIHKPQTDAIYTKPSTGIVRLQFIPADGEDTSITCVADIAGSLNNKYFTLNSTAVAYYTWFNVNSAGVDPRLDIAEVTPLTCVANTSGSLNGKYFRVSSPTVNYYVWYQTDGVGTNPSAANAGRTGILVNLPAGDSIASAVATLTASAMTTAPYDTVFGAIGASNLLTITNLVIGAAPDATIGDSGFTLGTITQGQTGVVGLAGKTGIAVAVATGATAIVVAAAVRVALAAVGGTNVFSVAVGTNSVVIVTNKVTGVATDATAGDSGFTVTVLDQGNPVSSFALIDTDVITVVANRVSSIA